LTTIQIPLDESPLAEPITEQTVMSDVGITEPEIERRKRLVGIRLEDQQQIALVRDVVERNVDALTDAFFNNLGREDARVPRYAELVMQARPLKRDHLLAMVRGRYDLAYARQRILLGLVYGRFGLETSVFLGAYHDLLAGIQRAVVRESKLPAPGGIEAFLSLRRVAFFDLSLQIDVLMHGREQLIRRQAQSIRDLSTPVLQLRDRLLLMPLIGVIDAQRVQMIADRLLTAIRRSRALVAVLDITGVATVEDAVASRLSEAVTAAQLMGTRLIITGISEQASQAMQWLKVDSERLSTACDLQAGIERAERLLARGGAMPPATKDAAAAH
jgi:rsbT co-antagonist protein RsbR